MTGEDAGSGLCHLLPSQLHNTSISSVAFLHNTLGTTPAVAATILPAQCLSCLGRTVFRKHGVSILRARPGRGHGPAWTVSSSAEVHFTLGLLRVLLKTLLLLLHDS